MITFGHFLPARYGSYSCTNLFGFVKTYASFNSTWVSFWQALVQMFQRGRSLRDTKTDMAVTATTSVTAEVATADAGATRFEELKVGRF